MKNTYYRLTAQDFEDFSESCLRILKLLSDGRWHTATEVIEVAGIRSGLERLRDLRKGGHSIESSPVADCGREWTYRLVGKGELVQEDLL